VTKREGYISDEDIKQFEFLGEFEKALLVGKIHQQ
jgi:hypothetical protein